MTSETRIHLAILYILTVVACVVGIIALSYPKADAATQPRTCFPAKKWDANQDYRPCVTVTTVYEDGSFAYKVSDHDGTVRYDGGVGAKDR